MVDCIVLIRTKRKNHIFCHVLTTNLQLYVATNRLAFVVVADFFLFIFFAYICCTANEIRFEKKQPELIPTHSMWNTAHQQIYKMKKTKTNNWFSHFNPICTMSSSVLFQAYCVRSGKFFWIKPTKKSIEII